MLAMLALSMSYGNLSAQNIYVGSDAEDDDGATLVCGTSQPVIVLNSEGGNVVWSSDHESTVSFTNIESTYATINGLPFNIDVEIYASYGGTKLTKKIRNIKPPEIDFYGSQTETCNGNVTLACNSTNVCIKHWTASNDGVQWPLGNNVNDPSIENLPIGETTVSLILHYPTCNEHDFSTSCYQEKSITVTNNQVQLGALPPTGYTCDGTYNLVAEPLL